MQPRKEEGDINWNEEEKTQNPPNLSALIHPVSHNMTAIQPAAPDAPSVPPKMMTSLRVGDDSIEVINQLLLPHEIQWDSCDSVEDAYDAIKSMRVSQRGGVV
jgi:hypothetical protein